MIQIIKPFSSFTFFQIALIGSWLDDNMPNPPLPEDQRWTVHYKKYDSSESPEGGPVDVEYIEFSDPHDAVLFALNWP